MAASNLSDRDGLHDRMSDVVCLVLLAAGTWNSVYFVAHVEQGIKLFTNSPDARLKTVENGQRFPGFSLPRDVDQALIDFV